MTHSKMRELADKFSRTSNSLDVDWEYFEAVLRVNLPGDYKEYAETFPPGAFKREMVGIWHPLTPFEDFAQDRVDECRILSERRSSMTPIPELKVFPDPGGILPWGYINMDWIFGWLTEGDPDQWTSVLMRPDFADVHYIHSGMVSTLIKLIENDTGISSLSYLPKSEDFIPRHPFP